MEVFVPDIKPFRIIPFLDQIEGMGFHVFEFNEFHIVLNLSLSHRLLYHVVLTLNGMV